MNQRLWRAIQVLCLAATLAACGGSDGEGGAGPSAVPGAATIGVNGGEVRSDDGAQVVVPKGALRGDATVRIAKDSTGAPPLPPSAVAAGAVYAITPHGGEFEDFVEVSIPVEQDGDGQLLLVTAEPGDTQWRVLSGASYHNGKMRAPVLHFSFFQTIRLVNQVMPALVIKIDGANNVGGPGTTLLSPLRDLPFLKVDRNSNCLGGCAIPVNTLVAELSLPTLIARPSGPLVGLPPAAPPTSCRPVDLGHGAMSFRFRREGSQEFFPTVDHPAVVPRVPWPRFPGDGGALTYSNNTTLGFGKTAFPGFGAIHYYGNESPRIFGLFDANPPTQAMIDQADREQNSTAGRFVLPVGNVYALPPAGDNPADNLYTWGGSVWWSATQNGSVRIDAAIMTTCGLLAEAVPLAFKLNAMPRGGFPETSFYAYIFDPTDTDPSNGSAEGSDVAVQFARYNNVLNRWTSSDTGITSYRVDYSPDPTRVDWQPVAASAVTLRHSQFYDYFTSSNVDAAGIQVSLPAVQPSQAGYYRVFHCEAAGCFASDAYQLIVLREPPIITAQPAGQTVQAGQTASFTVATSGAPLPALQWQKRSFLAAAFGFAAWTNIDGATGATYTTPPLTMADTATQYRAWATNALGAVASDIAMLTVVERFLPPVIVAQPGNLNVTVGGTAVFAATVSGSGPLSFQWRRNGVNIAGANSTILTLNSVTALNEGRYELVVSNSAGSVTTEPGLLQVTLGTPAALAPAIAAAPASITVAEGNAANFAVAVTGTGPYSYQWFKGGVQAPIANSDSASFSIAAVAAADAGSYSVRVTNSVGQVLSAAATLTVVAGNGVALPPTIITAPVALAVMPDGGATFAVAVSGTAPFSYQWRRNGVDIAGATGTVLHIAAASAFDAGQYTVEASNAAGAASSSGVPLIVIGAPAIAQQPVAASVTAGQTATLSVAASGSFIRYQWTRNGVAIPGAESASYTTPALALADSGAVLAVVVYNGAGVVFSSPAVLTVTAPAGFAANAVLLGASDSSSGVELWMTDGSAAGTVFLKDINPGGGHSFPQRFTRFGSHMYFSADNGSNGRELWRTDGTSAGTVLFADVASGGTGSFPNQLTVCNGALFFGANGGASGQGLYKTDGTAAGTVRLGDASVPTGTGRTLCLNNVLYFTGGTAASGEELWRSDGSVSGTVLLMDIEPGTGGSSPEHMTQFLGQVYFATASGLWKTDGTAGGTVAVASGLLGKPSWLTANGGTLYFSATNASGTEPWKSDGTSGGTSMIVNLNAASSSFPYKFTVSNGITYFAAEQSTNSQQLFRTDGTAAGTTSVRFISPGRVATRGDSIFDVNGTLYFYANESATGEELWKTDGTDLGTVIVSDIQQGTAGSLPTAFFQLGGLLYFNASDGSNGFELWRSDGTVGGTVLVKDMCPGTCSSDPQPR